MPIPPTTEPTLLAALLAALPIEQRLAMAYAPSRARRAMLGLLAFDARLAGLIRGAREPMLAQIKLAWWRERLGEPGPAAVAGEPLLDLLREWGGESAGLARLVDGWEHLLAQPPLAAPAFELFAEARGAAFAALARQLGEHAAAAEAERAARNWALADLAARLGQAAEREAACELVTRQDWRRPVLPRSLRPLLVLHALARRSAGTRPLLSGPGALALAARVGMLGF